jgi:hypothetical protein
MSYDLGLYKKGTKLPVIVDCHLEGGTYVLGGTTEAELNITYNYSKYYYQCLDEKKGIRWLYGKTGAETIDRLQQAINILGTIRDNNYWLPTPGNAGRALQTLLLWAKQNPKAIWDGD